MMAGGGGVGRVFRAENKQRGEGGGVERVLGALQAFAQHALRIEAHFPIDRNHSIVRHELFSSENKNGNPLISCGDEMSIRGWRWRSHDSAGFKAPGGRDFSPDENDW